MRILQPVRDLLARLLAFIKTSVAWVAIAVILLFALTHGCHRGGCYRYPWAGLMPMLGGIEAAMSVIALGTLGWYFWTEYVR